MKGLMLRSREPSANTEGCWLESDRPVSLRCESWHYLVTIDIPNGHAFLARLVRVRHVLGGNSVSFDPNLRSNVKTGWVAQTRD